MKLTDLKREHFQNGQTFSQKMLDAYLAARMQARKDFLTRYPLCLLGGVAVGFVLSLFLTGFIKILLPMLCVMGGALIGARITTGSMDQLRRQTEKICLSKKDIRKAKQHLKNGTVAWTEKKEKLNA